MNEMLSNKPYFLRGLYQWIVDSHCTPYIMVSIDFPKVQVPQDYVQDGRIVLDISPEAIRDLEISNKSLSFTASFGGVVQEIYAPMPSIMAIYAMENGRGMSFEDEVYDPDAFSDDEEAESTEIGDRGHLHIVE